MSSVERRSLPVPDGLAGERADAALARLLGFSRTFAAEIVEAGGATLDGHPLGKSDRLTAGGWLEVEWTPKTEPRIVPALVPGLRGRLRRRRHRGHRQAGRRGRAPAHPAGRVPRCSARWRAPATGSRPPVPPSAPGSCTASMSARAASWWSRRASRPTPQLKRAFHDREVDKIYHAVVQGHPDPLSGTIDAPIGRHPSSDWKFAVVAGGKPSITHYDTLEAMRAASLLEIHLETGRTHQIRVHMAAQRHPCVGDLLYGADPVLAARLGLTRQWLHAVRLGFRHPATGEYVEFETRYPEDLQHALDVLRAD